MRKLTTEDFILKARQVHRWKYDYSKVEYINCFKKVEIICPKHGVFLQSPSKHLSGDGCPACSNVKRLTTETFIEKAINLHGDIYDYSKVKYINNHTKVCIICKEHGEFWQKANGHLHGNGCPCCAINKRKEKEKLSLEDFVKKARITHGNKYDYSKVDYINNSTKICIICPIHGEFWQNPNNHIRGKGCSKCKGGVSVTKEHFIDKANKKHNYKYDYSLVKYVNVGSKVDIICPMHGLFKQSPRDHLSGYGCPKCNSSHGELKIEECLKNNNIKYKSQYPVKLEKQMFSRNNLRIDFYLPDFNTFVEFNGEQHYKFSPFFHKSEEDFQMQVERDKRLKEYCKENKIKLIVIKYNQIDKIEEILNKKLNIK